MKENQRRVPVRDWSLWNHGNSDVIGNYGYPYRGRRGVAIPTKDKDHDVKGDSKVVRLKKQEIVRNIPNRNAHSSYGHHHRINDMSLEEIERILKNTLEKVNKITENERIRLRKRNHHKSEEIIHGNQTGKLSEHSVKNSGLRTDASFESVTKTAESSPSTIPNTAIHASLPLVNSTHNSTKSSKNNTLENSLTNETKINSISESGFNNSKTEATNINKNETVHSVGSKTFNVNNSKDKEKSERKHSENKLKEKLIKKRRRKKRHVGPHDEGGLQRLISTGKARVFSSFGSSVIHWRRGRCWCCHLCTPFVATGLNIEASYLVQIL